MGAWLVAAGAGVVLVLGSLHLLYTFRGPAFDPRDAALKLRMQEVSPVISRDTTMWKAWISFNATHSLGAMLFGLVYGYLALAQSAVLFQSWFLLAVGGLMLASFVALGSRYWFSIPFRGSALAAVLYFAGVALRFA
ncbi:MAG: hypothetical protein HYX47_16090 [Burkholderiales bacterium]|nr:hypothetical protein [Burkholderiales bacterium]